MVGYVIGFRPNAYILANFVKNWGENVKFEIQVKWTDLLLWKGIRFLMDART